MLSNIKYVIFIFLTITLFADVDFTNPTSTTGSGGTPDLSDLSANTEAPQITTSSTGQYVYAVWERGDVIQVAKSANYGVNWVDPTTTTGDGVPDLSKSAGGETSQTAQVTTSSTGQYVYAIWELDNLTTKFIQVARSTDYGVNWVDPTTVTGDTVPNLSKGPDPTGGDAIEPQIATSSTGQYVYATWRRDNGTNDIVQVSKSSDYGDNWVNPTTVTGDGGVPDLSDTGGGALLPQIATDSTGQYVYVIWKRLDAAFKFIIQVAISSNYGVDWVDPTTVTGDGGTPNLSDNLQNADVPQIAAAGSYVYAIWQRTDGTNTIIQVAISSNYGVAWSDPTTVTGDHAGNLSKDGQNANYPQITTDSTGEYVYAIWERSDGTNTIIQAVISSDYGDTWVNPTTTPPDAPQTPPDLSVNGENATYAQIATNSTGESVYAVWQRSDGTVTIIQTALSLDYGVTWIDPTTVTGTQVPDLSIGRTAVADGAADVSQVTIDSTGEYIYVTWRRDNGSNTIIQAVNGANPSPNPEPAIHFPIMFKPKR